MQTDLESVRGDTPGVQQVTHLNNAGAALPPRIVVDTMVDHLRREATIGGYEAAAEAADRLEAVYPSLAALVGADPSQIAVVENATRAWDMAVYGYPFRRGDRVLTARAEYASNAIALLQLAQRHGIEVVLIDDDEDGQISLEQLERELEAGAAMVSLTHIPTNGGLINPAREVGRLCREHGTFFVLDACQSVGQIPIDVVDLGCNVLSATGRKFLRGPRGTGFLFVDERAMATIEPPFLDLHAASWTGPNTFEIRSDARRFENWETNFAGKLGLGAAADYALAIGLEAIAGRVADLASELRSRLTAIDGVTVHDKGVDKCGIVTFTIDGHATTDVKDALSRERINTSVSPLSYAQFDLPERGLGDLVRASVHYYNTSVETGRLVDEVERIASSMSRLSAR